MKDMVKFLTVTAAVALAACSFGQLDRKGNLHPMHTPAHASQSQKVTIVVDGGYKPSSVTVKAGKPVELTFVGKNLGCGNVVVFKDLKIRQKLTAGKSTVVKFTPKKPGTLNFACGMGMYHGQVIVK